jgi:hypothetical protein
VGFLAAMLGEGDYGGPETILDGALLVKTLNQATTEDAVEGEGVRSLLDGAQQAQAQEFVDHGAGGGFLVAGVLREFKVFVVFQEPGEPDAEHGVFGEKGRIFKSAALLGAEYLFSG